MLASPTWMESPWPTHFSGHKAKGPRGCCKCDGLGAAVVENGFCWVHGPAPSLGHRVTPNHSCLPKGAGFIVTLLKSLRPILDSPPSVDNLRIIKMPIMY